MADRVTKGGGKATDLSVMARLMTAAKFVITGAGAETFFGPGQPIAPAAPEAAGRQWDYPSSINIHTTPRSTEAVNFATMRALADNYDLLRTIIETSKDRLCRMKWKYVVKGDDKTVDDPRTQEIANFFNQPDRENDWMTWYRILLEDLFVIDAPTIYVRKTKGGLTGPPRPFSLEIIDGATICRKIDADGRTPMAPDPAYQQIIKGLPAVNYTREELLYLPKNKRSNKLYGFSHVEQIIMTVNIALRRQIHQLEYYTEGNTPDLLFRVPETWQPDQIKQMQLWWDTLTGDTANRRKGRFIPGGVDPYDTKQKELKDEFDEWLARLVCFQFSISPQPFVKEMNRATAETAEDTAKQEGLEPVLAWTKSLKDRIIRDYFGWPDIEATWEMERELDPVSKSTIEDQELRNGTRTINEIRKGRGEKPVEGGDEPIIFTASGPVLLKDVINPPAPEPTPTFGQPPAPGKELAAPETLPERIERLKKKALNRSTGSALRY